MNRRPHILNLPCTGVCVECSVMHIKRIIVEGFKSYRDRQKIPAKTEFVEGHCVVGAWLDSTCAPWWRAARARPSTFTISRLTPPRPLLRAQRCGHSRPEWVRKVELLRCDHVRSQRSEQSADAGAAAEVDPRRASTSGIALSRYDRTPPFPRSPRANPARAASLLLMFRRRAARPARAA